MTTLQFGADTAEFVSVLQERMDNHSLTFLGVDKHGFRYYRNDHDEDADLYREYIYQQHPTDRDYWSRGHNHRGEYAGWVCTTRIWERTFHKRLVS